MVQQNKRLVAGGEDSDRLSGMPRYLIDHIFGLLSMKDAVRTSVLNQSWRYIWAMNPNIVLNARTCRSISENNRSEFCDTISGLILQRHDNKILKFVLDLSQVSSFVSRDDINMWIFLVILMEVKELNLNISNNRIYKLMSFLCNYEHLTHLSLFNCILEPPNSILSCPKLKTLYLEDITFNTRDSEERSCVVKATVLVYLTLKKCPGTKYLSVISPQLSHLSVAEIDYFDLSSFMSCTNLTFVSLALCKEMDNPRQDEQTNLWKFIFELPLLQRLSLGSFCLKFLGVDPVARNLFVMPSCLRHIMLSLKLSNLVQVSCTLDFIQLFANLQILQIWAFDTRKSTEDVLKYLEAPHNFERPLDKLEQVAFQSFRGSKLELQLIKLLLAETPSSVKMSIENNRVISRKEERKIFVGLLRYPRASPNEELIYA